MLEIRPVDGAGQKAEICEGILRALPDWFEIEEAIVGYSDKVRDLPLWAAFEEGRTLGFVALEGHGPYAAEVVVMGVLPELHRRGLGRGLLACCEAHCLAHDVEYLTVKTLAETAPDEFYARTRRFYYGVGFRPLEVLPTLWGEGNPCLLMAKHLPCSA